MSWIATLTRMRRVRDVWRFTISYFDDVNIETFEKHYRQPSLTKKGLRDLARNEAAALAANETTDVDIPLGTTIDVTPDPVIPPDPPTQDEIDKSLWFQEYTELKQLLEVTTNIPVLLTAQAITAISDLRTNLNLTWKNSYRSDL